VPPLSQGSVDMIISGGENVLKKYANMAYLKTKDLISLIEDFLNPAFNPNDVDTDMLERLNASFGASVDARATVVFMPTGWLKGQNEGRLPGPAI
jgi:hypothetical protein